MPHPICDSLAPAVATVARVCRSTAISAVLAWASLTTTACASPPGDIRLADAGDHRVAYRVLGNSGPVIVLISGLGEGMSSFDRVGPELARNATVIVYDRAGYGRSDPAPAGQDAAAAEGELLALLRATGLPGPYFILGHSLGGSFAEYFAARHPDLVAGLILEESRPADFASRCESARIPMCSPTPAMMMLSPRGAQGEVAALGRTMDEVAALPVPPPPGPRVLVLTRHASSRPGRFEVLWMQAQADLARRYQTDALAAPAGGHDIHHEQPAWFVATVRGFVHSDVAGRVALTGSSNEEGVVR